MRLIGKIGAMLVMALMVACSPKYDYQYFAAVDEAPCDKTKDVAKAEPVVHAPVQRAPVTLSGLKYCPNTRQCSDEALLPPQPCVQPMPMYYNDISELEYEQGVLLIHPLTRAKVLCYERDDSDAVACAERFLGEGYVLITDIPQFAGRYDFLRDGDYPARRWRHGEKIPRW